MLGFEPFGAASPAVHPPTDPAVSTRVDSSITRRTVPYIMAAQFCMSCGKPLPPGAQFCFGCGAPVAGATPSPGPSPAPLHSSAPPTPGLPSPPAAAPPLSTLLGVQGIRKFVLQHLLIGPKHSYRVMDPQKRHLFTVGENVREERQEVWRQLVHPSQNSQPRFQVTWGGTGPTPMSYWALDDVSGNVQGVLTLQLDRGTAVTTLTDATGVPVLAVHVTRGVTSIDASVASPDGRPMLEAHMSLFHHNFSVHDALGVEVARIHEATLTARDTYDIELVGNVDPLTALVFAILIDHYKGK